MSLQAFTRLLVIGAIAMAVLSLGIDWYHEAFVGVTDIRALERVGGDRTAYLIGQAVNGLLGLICSVLAIRIVWRAPDSAAARLVAIIFAMFFASLVVPLLAPAALSMVLSGFHRLSEVFPRQSSPVKPGEASGRWYRRRFPSAWAPPAIVTGALMVGWLSRGSEGSLLLAAFVSAGIVTLQMLFVPFLALVNFTRSYRTADARDRERLKWIFTAAVILGLWVGTSVIAVAKDWQDVLYADLIAGTLFEMGVIGSLAMAVLSSGALDSGLMLRRTTIVGGLGLVAVAAFVGIEELVTNVLAARLGLSGNAGAWIAGVAVALALGPLRALFDRLTGRVSVHFEATPSSKDAAAESSA